MNKNPLVSIIIPTYNYGRYINEAINSVLNSNFPQEEIEIVVIDDGSTDNTFEKVKAYGNRVKYIFQENSGKAWATKIGIDNCHGKYLFNLDADDIFLPNKIQEVVQIFERDSNIVHVAHPAIYWKVYEEKKTVELIPQKIVGKKIYGRELLTFFYRRRMLFGGGSTFAGRMDIIKKFSIPKEVDMYIDEYLVMCTLNRGYSYFINSPLSVWRIHQKNYSGSDLISNSFESKIIRDFNSIEGVLQNLNDFEQEIRNIYLLKVKVSDVAYKEKLGNKKLSDIINLWLYFFKKFNTLDFNSWIILKNYTLLNRTMPTFLLKGLKIIKQKIF